MKRWQHFLSGFADEAPLAWEAQSQTNHTMSGDCSWSTGTKHGFSKHVYAHLCLYWRHEVLVILLNPKFGSRRMPLYDTVGITQVWDTSEGECHAMVRTPLLRQMHI